MSAFPSYFTFANGNSTIFHVDLDRLQALEPAVGNLHFPRVQLVRIRRDFFTLVIEEESLKLSRYT